MAGSSGEGDRPLGEVVAGLDEGTARRLLVGAAERFEDVSRVVRLAAAGEGERLRVLRVEVDRGLRTRRHLDYWESSSWARDASSVVDALADAVTTGPSVELVVLLQRAAGHLVKVILRSDDSNGEIGDLARRVLLLHREACATGIAEPVPLAKWMARFAFEEQDFFEVDPVAYLDALGEQGLAVYRREVAKRSAPVEGAAGGSSALGELYAGFPSFAAKYAAERLAVIDGDVDRLVELLGGDLSSAHQFTRVAEAMVELGRPDDALGWARRGIAETNGWQLARLYDLAAGFLADAGDLDEVVALRRHHHDRMPTSSTYTALQNAARATDTWDGEVATARAVLAERDPSGFIDVLLADGEPEAAWASATSGDRAVPASQWLRLAEAREPDHPADALDVYLRLADDTLLDANKRAYRDAARLLKRARRAASAACLDEEFDERLADVREQYRRRPTLIATLDKAGLR